MGFNIGPGWAVTSNPLGSVSFNGSNQYLTTASAIIPASTDFTIECWVYPTSFAAIIETFSQYTAATTGRLDLNIAATTGIPNFFIGDTVNLSLISSIALVLNTWSHLAVTRSGNNYVLYVNGVSAATGSASTAILQKRFMVGALDSSPISRYFPGYISNLRVVSGVVVYTGNFTPSTQPLPATQPAGTNIAAITGTQTSLLLNTPNDANFIKDSSANNFTLTNNGSATASALTPFNFSPLGSVRFNGSTQYLTIPNNAVFNFGSGAFTVEAWVYCNSSVTSQQCIVTNYGSATTGWALQVEAGKFIANFSGDGNDIQGTTAIITNRWYHVAISGATGSIKMFVDGNLDGTYAGATTLDSSAALSIGRIASSAYLNGYISNLRIVKGVAIYTDAFTPPAAPLKISQNANTNIAAVAGTQTSLLLQTPNNSAFIADSSTNNFTLTNNGTATATALTPFNTNQATAGQWTFTSVPPMVDYLVVAGGGSGAGAGGGGAGGLLTGTSLSLAYGATYTVTVGAGGAIGGGSNPGGNGQPSVFGPITATGGGGSGYSLAGGNGGSGGGSSYYGLAGGIGIFPGSTYISGPRQGYNGGIGYNSGGGTYNGGGGGGAGGNGVNGATGGSVGGAGGVGAITTLITTTQATTYAVGQVVSGNVYFAGGGGAAGASVSGAGGSGGGANGNPSVANSGVANTGGGGAGGNSGGPGAGGKGVVIIRYPNTLPVAASTTGSPILDTVTGGYNTYIFTSSGSITF